MKNIIKYLEENQNKNGSFSDIKKQESIFLTSLILSCLNKIKEDKNVKNIKKKAVDFLISKKDKRGIYSNNLGINFSVLSSLFEYNSEIIDGKMTADFLNVLTSNEKKEGGPYYSEISNKKDIDLFVNYQIGYFLSLLEVELPNILNLIKKSIISQNFNSSYFSNKYFIIYLISKIYGNIENSNGIENDENIGNIGKNKNIRMDKDIEKNKEKLIKYILKNKGNNVLEDFLSVISLCNLGCQFSKFSDLIKKLKKYSEQDLKKSYSFGKSKILSEELKSTPSLNISFYLGAIECLEKRDENKEKNNKKEKEREKNEEIKKKDEKEEKEIFLKIMKIARKRFSLLGKDMEGLAWEQIAKTITNNKDNQMSLISYYFKKTLGKKGRKISDKLIAQMGLANILYWTAFIIYDDFWDEDEEANPKILPTANFYSRDFLFFFNSLFKNDNKFNIFIRNLMDKLDKANTWETIHCRTKKINNKIYIPKKFPDFKDYTIKYEPASAHILGPIAILKMIGYNENSSQAKNLIKYFKNYLITKQFNDDLHDWQEDLSRGHLSTTTAEILKIFSKKYPNQKIIDVDKDLEKLQEIYWFDVLPKICQISLTYSKSSRNALNKLDILEDKSYLEKFIDIPEKYIKEALIEQKKSIDFLESYKI